MNPLANLKHDGFWQMHGAYHVIADSLQNRLKTAPAFTGHVITQGDGQSRTLDEAIKQEHGFVCHRMADILAVPSMFSLLTIPHAFASAYFGEDAFLYSVNAFWKKPSGAPGWHHDSDDGPKQLVMFMYGTDVLTDADGVHAYVTGSHQWPREKLKPFHNVQEDVSGPLPQDWPVHKFYGKRGTAFLTDTTGLHNGFAPIYQPRLLLWGRWCAGVPPQSYKNDKIVPVPWTTLGIEKPSEEVQRRTKFVVDWSQ